MDTLGPVKSYHWLLALIPPVGVLAYSGIVATGANRIVPPVAHTPSRREIANMMAAAAGDRDTAEQDHSAVMALMHAARAHARIDTMRRVYSDETLESIGGLNARDLATACEETERVALQAVRTKRSQEAQESKRDGSVKRLTSPVPRPRRVDSRHDDFRPQPRLQGHMQPRELIP